MKLNKIMTTVAATLAIAAMSVVPAFAATASLYTQNAATGVWATSTHSNACISSVTERSDGEYEIVFQYVARGGVVGYISEFAGEDITYEDGLGTLRFTEDVTVDINNDGEPDGTLVDFVVTMENGDTFTDHPYDNAVIVFN